MKILIGAPVKQDPETLRFYLDSLVNLDKRGLQITYCFVDDNDDGNSKIMLSDFVKKHGGVILLSQKALHYEKNDNKHVWKEQNIWHVANVKNEIIQYAIDGEYDYLFFVDSDLVLHPPTLKQLMEHQKDIISEIYWTSWSQNAAFEMPQVWLKDQYTLYEKEREEKITKEEASKRMIEFLQKLRVPGLYEVGGLGALTLISKNALLKGVNFSEIKNLSFTGEDRHFCVRAQALGLDLFVDTHYPAFHLYREEDMLWFKRNKPKM